MSTVCHSYHLTSFAVLVSVKHEPEQVSINHVLEAGDNNDSTFVSLQPAEAKALTVISYIGCGVSIVCLLISIVVLSLFLIK